MKKYLLLAAVVVAAFVGCGGGGGSSNPPVPTGSVGIQCADLTNAGGTNDCAPTVALSFFPSAHAAVTIIDAGVISRSQLVEASLTVSNATANAWQGYFGMVFDAGCNGAATWEIAPVQPTQSINTGETWSTTIGGSCGDMPLGQHTLTATLYDTDPATVLDTVQVQFMLVE